MIFRLLACAVFLGSLSWAAVPAPPVPGVSDPPELRLLRACVEKSSGSVMVSPFSLYEVLRYMLPGAAGETERQMRAVLPGDGGIRKDWIFLSDDFSRSLRCYSANRIFADRSVKLKEAYQRTVGPEYVSPAPFRENMPEAVRLVNSWAARNTKNRIRQLLDPQVMSDRTVLVLVNAMYMRAFWESKFEGKDTVGRVFVREDGTSCKVPMMKQQVFMEGSSWPRQGGMYGEKNGVRGASLFLAGGKGAPVLMAVLPPEGKKLKQFIAGMTAEEWNGLLSSLSVRAAAEEKGQRGRKPLEQYSRYHLRLPRFSISPPTLSLKEALETLGMKDAFTGRADFSRMGSCSSEPLKIHDVYQKCAIRVCEDGLEAAASSAGDMDPFAGPLPLGKGPEIEFNRPFLWLIYSPEDRAVLFMGTYAGPEGGKKAGSA
ncbi:MAG: serpin family protein [Akkermansia sp.]|nr:serpin family protein [Akkermansia sp.]MCC8148316.1 serpin family protein [Akkermansia sp.]